MAWIRGLKAESGFTLAELLVACAVITFVMAGLLVTLQSGQQSYLVGSHQIEAQQNLRVALERMAREIQQAGYCPTCIGTAPFTAIASQSATGFTLQNDWDGSGAIDTSSPVTNASGTTRGEQIVYAVSGGALTRQEVPLDGSPVTLATGVANLAFSYQDDTGTVTATAADIRTVVMSVTTRPQFQPAATQQGRVLVTMTDTARLRNR